MALELILDTVEGGEVQQSLRDKSAFVRSGIVKGLTSAVTTSKLALMDAINSTPGMPAFSSKLDDTLYPKYLLTYKNARGIDGTGGQMARVWLRYETGGTQATPIETFTYRETGQIGFDQAIRMPGASTPFRCNIDDTSPDYEQELTDSDAKTRPVIAPIPVITKVWNFYGLFEDRPSALDGIEGTVNSTTFLSRPKGHVLAYPPDIAFSNKDGLWRASVSLASKGSLAGQDWSTVELARLPNGEYVKPPASKIAEAINKPYDFAVLYDKNGIWRAGTFPLRNFAGILS